jgi:transcription elongation GreA/GreB family factor
MKSELIALVCVELRSRLERLARAARAAHAAATDPGSKAESKYDTRSLEESYLATGQARQVQELAETLRIFENLRPVDFSKSDEIGSGALVEVERGAEKMFFLLVPAAGGMEIFAEGKEITLLSSESPLYQALVGKRVGDTLDAPPFWVRGVF